MKELAHIKLDHDVKAAAQKLARELGFSFSALINTQLKQLVRDKQVTLSLKPRRMSVGLEELLAEVEQDIRKKKNLSPPIRSRKELDAYFKSL